MPVAPPEGAVPGWTGTGVVGVVATSSPGRGVVAVAAPAGTLTLGWGVKLYAFGAGGVWVVMVGWASAGAAAKHSSPTHVGIALNICGFLLG